MTNCFQKLFFLFAAFFFCLQLPAQKTYHHQISVVSDNDNYTFKRKDRYYTNGLSIRFSKLTKDASADESKKILTIEAGQKIYNPYKQNKDFMETMDRPFTGFLFLKGGLTYISPKENIFRWSALAGVIGKAALGQEVQQWHHRNFHLPTPHGWETQLKSEAVMNVQAAYYQRLLSTKKEGMADVHLKTEINVGTVFTGISSGAVFKLGAFEKAGNSAQWDARLHQYHPVYRRNYELYFYFEPALTYQVFNATVQGGLFTRKKDTYTTAIKPVYYSHSFGVVYAKNRWTTQLGLTYKTREATTMRANENFGTIGLSYRFN
jgi:hypothetical protein